MSDETMERDLELAEALRVAMGDVPEEQVDWSGLREAVGRRAAPALAKHRATRLRRRVFAPGAAVAASAALLVFALRGTPSGPQANAVNTGGAEVTLEQMLDLDASDEEVRALLSGAGDMDELLLLAAAGEETE
jgi:hypothetical protein